MSQMGLNGTTSYAHMAPLECASPALRISAQMSAPKQQVHLPSLALGASLASA